MYSTSDALVCEFRAKFWLSIKAKFTHCNYALQLSEVEIMLLPEIMVLPVYRAGNSMHPAVLVTLIGSKFTGARLCWSSLEL